MTIYVAMYKNILFSFIRVLQKSGLKELSELTIRKTFCLLKKIVGKHPYLIFRYTFDKIKIYFEVKSIKIAGTVYKVPTEIEPRRQMRLTLKYLISSSSKNSVCSLGLSLANETFASYNLVSHTVKSCDDFHKMAEQNRIYIQYRY